MKTSKRTSRWRARRRQIETDIRRREVALASIVSAAERSAVAVTVESPREEITNGFDLDGNRAGLADDARRRDGGTGRHDTEGPACDGAQAPRALATLLEAIALWQGQPVRAALCADAWGLSCDSNLCREAFLDHGGALYSVAWVHAGAHRRRRPRLDGLGSFRDLERLVISEVAR